MANPFTSVTCAIRYDNARVISWTLMSKASYPADAVVSIENARQGGPWSTLSSTLSNVCFYVDTRKRNYNKKMNECYRLRLTSAATGESYVSEIVTAGQTTAYPFSAEAENVIRQAEKAIELSGCTGVLLKRKHWGARCPDCTDFDGQQSVNEHCSRCLGTGVDGGYYQGISMSVIKDRISTTEEQGKDSVEASETVDARCIAYPWIRHGDVWVEDGTNKRYYVQLVTPASSYKSTTLIYTIRMHRIEYTDVMYSSVAASRLNPANLFDSAQVNYTPAVMSAKEANGLTNWAEGLSGL